MASRPSRLERALLGALAGLCGTASHTAVMAAASRLGILGEPPPEKITRAMARSIGLRPHPHEPALHAATLALHAGFGAAIGVTYALLCSRRESITPASGAAFASGVWALSYGGWAPAIGAMPPPSRDRRGRPTAMWLAHVAFGVTTAAVLRRLRG